MAAEALRQAVEALRQAAGVQAFKGSHGSSSSDSGGGIGGFCRVC